MSVSKIYFVAAVVLGLIGAPALFADNPPKAGDPYVGLYGNTLTCIGADWGCHAWFNKDGTMKSINYEVVPGKYEFARDAEGKLIKLREQDGKWSIEEGRLCRHLNRPTLCDTFEAGKKVGDKWSINAAHGREDFAVLAGHQ